MADDVRWKQRFNNLKRAFALLEEAAVAENLSMLEQEGLVQRFEYTFELSWKTLKDLLEERGMSMSFPRDVLKQAFASGLLADGDAWIEMLEQRNTLSHTYNEAAFEWSVRAVREKYYPCIRALVEALEREA